MATEFIIAPRRNEPIVGPGGFPTARFSEYVERAAVVVNESDTSITDITTELADFEFLEFWRS